MDSSNPHYDFIPSQVESDDMLAMAVKEAVREEDTAKLMELTQDLHHADSAALLTILPPSMRPAVIEVMGQNLSPEILPYLNDEIISEMIEVLGNEVIGEALSNLETDDAVSVMEDLDEEEQQDLLDQLSDDTRLEVEEGLAYPEESAGRLMQKRFVSVPEFWNVGKVIDYLRTTETLPEDFYEIIVVNPRFSPVGTVMISRIMQNHRQVPIADIMKTDIHPIRIDTDQEAVAELFHRYALAEAPVVNHADRVVGVITIDDIVTVIKEEEEEDFMRSGGILEQDMHSSLVRTVRQRLPWLVVNLVTASAAAWVIGRFEATIEQMVTLAVLMPVIASLAGNAATQSLTIAVRGIATREYQRHNAITIIRKEILTNLLNSLVLSLITTAVIWLVYKDWQLAGIFAIAVIGTLTIAGFAGAIVPLILSRLNIDPAIASGVFVTTLTDVVSFFSFLGLAAWLIL